MARVFPQASPSHSSSCCSAITTRSRRTYTIWTKSLIFNGNGCTVFDSKGEMAYRIDNYNCTSSREVYLMDAQGNVLVSIFKKNLNLLGSWVGYNSSDSKAGRPWFIVKKKCKILKGKTSCKVSVDLLGNQLKRYKLEGSKSGCMSILNQTGEIVAEIQKKVGSSGVRLGPDVFSLVMEFPVDPSLIMGLVVVYFLMKGNM